MTVHDPLVTPRMAAAIDRHWVAVTLFAWLAIAGWLLFNKWVAVQGMHLGDTDDNLRLQQVRDLLAGQGWYDLRQHRLDPATGGASIHWSRIVDLPLAGLILFLKPLLGTVAAERWAIAIAPLLPLGLTLFALATAVRRAVHKAAYPLALIALALAGSAIGAFNPTRIDHHGWQLASLALVMAGLADPRRARGGVTVGLASGLSLAIGLEMMIYLALAAAALVLAFVVRGRDEEPRLAGYAAALALAVVPGFLLFASNDNRAALCDALTPVWLADALVGAGLLLLLIAAARTRLGAGWRGRLALAALAGIAIAAFHAVSFPQCLSRLEGVSAEATRLWLSNVKEARPIYRHDGRVMMMVLGLPVIGLIGFALLMTLGRLAGDRRRAVASLALLSTAALALLFWQTRAGPAAQLLAIPGSVAIVTLLGPWIESARQRWVRMLVALPVFIGLGIAWPILAQAIPRDKPSKARQAVGKANVNCWKASVLKGLDSVPPGTMLTHVDLGPRLLTMTHHGAIAGPYHRNDTAIVDVMLAFRGTPEAARMTAMRHRADYVLLCPGMSETTLYRRDAPNGFYAQLASGRVPDWLEEVALPKGSPFRLWKLVSPPAPGGSASARR